MTTNDSAGLANRRRPRRGARRITTDSALAESTSPADPPAGDNNRPCVREQKITPLHHYAGLNLRLCEFVRAQRDANAGLRSGGGCDIPPLVLELSPDQNVIAAQQVVVDLDECSTLWQIGTPLADDWDDTSGMTHASSPNIGDLQTDMPSRTIALLTTQVSAGYYKAWIVDIINLTMTSVQQNVAWSWPESCVTSRSADVDTYWRSGTGWEPPYNTSYLLAIMVAQRNGERRLQHSGIQDSAGQALYTIHTAA